MLKDKLVTVPAAVTLAMLLAGLALFAWHLAIHPEPQLTEPQLTEPDEDVPLRAEGIAALVAVASRHDDDVALRFDPVVHGRDLRNFRRHLRHIALRQGWYPHDGGACRSLVVPEADLHLLYEMERDPRRLGSSLRWRTRIRAGVPGAGPGQRQRLCRGAAPVRSPARPGHRRMGAVHRPRPDIPGRSGR